MNKLQYSTLSIDNVVDWSNPIDNAKAFMTGIDHLVQHFCRYKKPRGDILLFLFRDTISDNIEPCEKRFFTATRYFHMKSGFSASVTDKV